MSGTGKRVPAIYSLEQKQEMIRAKVGKRAVLRDTETLVAFTVEEVEFRPGSFHVKGPTIHGIHLKFDGPPHIWLPYLNIDAGWGYAHIEPNYWWFCPPFPGAWQVQFDEMVCDVVAEVCKVNRYVDKELRFKIADRAFLHARQKPPSGWPRPTSWRAFWHRI